jgi:hypothetical protein
MAKAPSRTSGPRDREQQRGRSDEREHDRSGGRDDDRPPQGNGRRLGGPRAAALARQQLEELIQRPCEAVSGLQRKPDGWSVVLEVVELERVPPTTDILATYRVDLDEYGDLIGYERVNRYYRNQAGGDS